MSEEDEARRVWDRLESEPGFNERVAEGKRQLDEGERVPFTEPRVVRLDDLTPEQRRLVLALIEAAKRENERKP